MTQATLDAFVKISSNCVDKPATVALPAPSDDKCVSKGGKGARGAVRLQAGGTASVFGLVEAARLQDVRAHIVLVTLSWRHCDACGADQVIVLNELSGAAYDFHMPKKPAKGEPKESPVTMGFNELCGMVRAGELIADLLLESARTHVVVVDGYPQGQIYARFAVCVAARCLKLRRSGKAVTQRATPPKDATCKQALVCLKKCRSIEAMHVAAAAHYEAELAGRFP